MNAEEHIHAVVRELKKTLPSEVAKLQYEIGYDADDDPALWIWVIIHEAQMESKWTFENRRVIRQMITEKLRDEGVEHWPFIYFRSSDEKPEPVRVLTVA